MNLPYLFVLFLLISPYQVFSAEKCPSLYTGKQIKADTADINSTQVEKHIIDQMKQKETERIKKSKMEREKDLQTEWEEILLIRGAGLSPGAIRMMRENKELRSMADLREYYVMNDPILKIFTLEEIHRIPPSKFSMVSLARIQETLVRATDEQFLEAIQSRNPHFGINESFFEYNISRIPPEDIHRFPELKKAPQSVLSQMSEEQKRALEKMKAAEINEFDTRNMEMFKEISDVSVLMGRETGDVIRIRSEEPRVPEPNTDKQKKSTTVKEENKKPAGWRRLLFLEKINVLCVFKIRKPHLKSDGTLHIFFCILLNREERKVFPSRFSCIFSGTIFKDPKGEAGYVFASGKSFFNTCSSSGIMLNCSCTSFSFLTEESSTLP